MEGRNEPAVRLEMTVLLQRENEGMHSCVVCVLGLPLIIVWLGSSSVTRLFSLPANCLELYGDSQRHNGIDANDH